jgi:hypothetical protein
MEFEAILGSLLWFMLFILFLYIKYLIIVMLTSIFVQDSLNILLPKFHIHIK